MTNAMSELRTRLAEVTDIDVAARVLNWDQQTNMPPGGAPARAEVMATLERLSHGLFTAAETGRLLEAAAGELQRSGALPDGDDARLVSVTRRDWEKGRRVPTSLAGDMARASSLGEEAWVAARQSSDFSIFQPYLERHLELKHRYVECFESFGYECAYDVVLDDFEAGMRTQEVAALFSELRAELVPLIAQVGSRAGEVDDSCLHGSFPVEAQRRLVLSVLSRMGFDERSWRLDDAVHPFAVGVANTDVRLTTRWDEAYWPSALYAGMHECGHGLYEAGITDALQRTPLGSATALGLHESQSRMWENMVGRGADFSVFLAPLLSEAFGRAVGPAELFRAVNRVTPSFIRVEADEATYGLHVVLRFELEQELIEGRLAARDLPEAWNARFAEFFSLRVPDDAHGVLQDVHWAAGMIGYFPTYAIGNLVAGQLWESACAELPALAEELAAGELAPLREWLREKVHRHGAKFTTAEIVQQVSGAPISVAPFVRYLKGKLTDVYGSHGL